MGYTTACLPPQPYLEIALVAQSNHALPWHRLCHDPQLCGKMEQSSSRTRLDRGRALLKATQGAHHMDLSLHMITPVLTAWPESESGRVVAASRAMPVQRNSAASLEDIQRQMATCRACVWMQASSTVMSMSALLRSCGRCMLPRLPCEPPPPSWSCSASRRARTECATPCSAADCSRSSTCPAAAKACAVTCASFVVALVLSSGSPHACPKSCCAAGLLWHGSENGTRRESKQGCLSPGGRGRLEAHSCSGAPGPPCRRPALLGACLQECTSESRQVSGIARQKGVRRPALRAVVPRRHWPEQIDMRWGACAMCCVCHVPAVTTGCSTPARQRPCSCGVRRRPLSSSITAECRPYNQTPCTLQSPVLVLAVTLVAAISRQNCGVDSLWHTAHRQTVGDATLLQAGGAWQADGRRCWRGARVG